jgi:hypothetical protein
MQSEKEAPNLGDCERFLYAAQGARASRKISLGVTGIGVAASSFVVRHHQQKGMTTQEALGAEVLIIGSAMMFKFIAEAVRKDSLRICAELHTKVQRLMGEHLTLHHEEKLKTHRIDLSTFPYDPYENSAPALEELPPIIRRLMWAGKMVEHAVALLFMLH